MSVIEAAKTELARLNFGEEDSAVMVKLLSEFFGHWESGIATGEALAVFYRLAQHLPLTPLLGTEDEWQPVSADHSDGDIAAQNKRYSGLFRRHDGTVFDTVNHVAFVQFPYMPPVSPQLADALRKKATKALIDVRSRQLAQELADIHNKSLMEKYPGVPADQLENKWTVDDFKIVIEIKPT